MYHSIISKEGFQSDLFTRFESLFFHLHNSREENLQRLLGTDRLIETKRRKEWGEEEKEKGGCIYAIVFLHMIAILSSKNRYTISMHENIIQYTIKKKATTTIGYIHDDDEASVFLQGLVGDLGHYGYLNILKH